MKKQTIIAALLLATTMSHGKEAPNRTETPANYLKYYVGYLNFLDLKEEQQSLLGENFDLKSFHQKILEIGPVQFPVLRKYMNEKL